MKYITILDYCWGKVWQFDYPDADIYIISTEDSSLSEGEAIEKWIMDKGFKLSGVSYMVHEDNDLYTEEDL
jgi:hypothetical protein